MRIFHPWVRQKLQRKVLVFFLLFCVVASVVVWRHDPVLAPTKSPSGMPTGSSPNSNQVPGFNKQQLSLNDPASLWVVVNKGRVLPSNYAPVLDANYGIRVDASSGLADLIAAAGQAGYSLRLYSGYRSYSNQVSTYNGYVKTDGVAKADTYSARPGHSEHQTGLAVDLSSSSGKCTLQICFGDLPEGQWLAANGYKFGFIVRYGKDQQDLTGYQYEPWHIRFVGKDLAAQIHQTGQTLEQFFGLPTYKLSDPYPADSYQLKAGI
jgi:D-alanyl-D-alanine carboxypeptidase